ncbi:MAG: ferrous iron transporter B [Caulobacterales bacterium]
MTTNIETLNLPTPRVALVGNPNSGKTALFNALTGGHQKVANYAGVTVEKKEGVVETPQGRRALVLDLPGTYSLRARSPDEVITRDVVLGKQAGEASPDLIVCVADSMNLRLVLRLVLELKAVGRPMILALNMIDIAEKRGLRIDMEGLSKELGVPVVSTVAVRKRGLDGLINQIDASVQSQAENKRLELVSPWQHPSAADIRAGAREAERILKAYVKPPERPDTLTDRADAILLHPVVGILTLLAILFVMFQAVFSWATPLMDLIDATFAWLGQNIGAMLPEGLIRSFVVDGMIAGVGSVVIFLPQILILFAFIILLEDFGYMARAAFLMDRMMGVTGLHGRAFIPLLSSLACAIPGIMATRVIDNRRDRIATIMVAPLMTCSARIPVYTLVIAAFIPRETVWGLFNLQGLVMFGLYASGIIATLLVAFVFRRVFWRGVVEPFLIELPSYKIPDPANVLRNVWQRGEVFLKRAGTIIFTLMVVVWFLSTFPMAPEGATEPAINYSFAGMLGHFIQPVLAPIGFNWEMSVALIPGMAAREVAVAALGTVYAISGADQGSLAATLAAQWSLPTALAFLTWYVFAPQCASTLGVVKRETNSWKWPAIMFGYMTALAYIAAFIVYRLALSAGL